VTDGIAIYNLLKQNQARINVNIEGWAASIASVIAMAGDEISMAENGLMMIHDPWGLAIGNAVDMRAAADVLDKMRDSIVMAYVKKATQKDQTASDEKFVGLMAAETWMTAQEALDHGLIDNITDSIKMAASFDLSKFKYHNIPKNFKHSPKNQEVISKFESISLRVEEKYRTASGSI
jgi:ATP-dependent Clp protease protease subunit